MEAYEKAKTQALEDFRKSYPNATSGDLQAFVLGMQACERLIGTVLGLYI